MRHKFSSSPRHKKRHARRGSELIEFTFALLPVLAMLFVLIDASWAIFAKATLQHAVHIGVRYGITITGTQATAAGESLTAMIKDAVQANAMGMLAGTTGRGYIKVHYFTQDSTQASGVKDVSTLSSGNSGGNLMQVSVENYPLSALVARIYSWRTAVDRAPTNLNVFSADKIEPTGDVPPIGTAP